MLCLMFHPSTVMVAANRVAGWGVVLRETWPASWMVCMWVAATRHTSFRRIHGGRFILS